MTFVQWFKYLARNEIGLEFKSEFHHYDFKQDVLIKHYGLGSNKL